MPLILFEHFAFSDQRKGRVQIGQRARFVRVQHFKLHTSLAAQVLGVEVEEKENKPIRADGQCHGAEDRIDEQIRVVTRVNQISQIALSQVDLVCERVVLYARHRLFGEIKKIIGILNDKTIHQFSLSVQQCKNRVDRVGMI